MFYTIYFNILFFIALYLYFWEHFKYMYNGQTHEQNKRGT